MAKTGNPADKRQQMSGQEVETLVNALISSTESPIGSNDVFKSERSASPRNERRRRSRAVIPMRPRSGARGGGALAGVSAAALSPVIHKTAEVRSLRHNEEANDVSCYPSQVGKGVFGPRTTATSRRRGLTFCGSQSATTFAHRNWRLRQHRSQVSGIAKRTALSKPARMTSLMSELPLGDGRLYYRDRTYQGDLCMVTYQDLDDAP